MLASSRLCRCLHARSVGASRAGRSCAPWPPALRPSAWTPSTSQISAVPSARVVSGDELSSGNAAVELPRWIRWSIRRATFFTFIPAFLCHFRYVMSLFDFGLNVPFSTVWQPKYWIKGLQIQTVDLLMSTMLGAALHCGFYHTVQSVSQQSRPTDQGTSTGRQGMASFILLTQHAALQCIHSLHIRLHIWSNEICFTEATQTNVPHQWGVAACFFFFFLTACVSLQS